jgi:transposase-like protein
MDTKNPYIIKIWRDSKWGREKKFDETFKEQAVEKILAGETTVSLMAKELGVHNST